MERVLQMVEALIATFRDPLYLEWANRQGRNGVRGRALKEKALAMSNYVSLTGPHSFWKQLEELVTFFEPMYSLMRQMDADSGSMGTIYKNMCDVSKSLSLP
jgi:hypothetical protein